MQIAIIGATGAVGRQLIKLLENRNYPLTNLLLFASKNSLGKSIPFKNEYLPIQNLETIDFSKLDLAFFAAGASVTKSFLPQVQSCKIIDLSSYLRKDPNIPLVIPEINSHLLTPSTQIISSPNCVASLMLLPLYPLHKAFTIKRIIASTYQAASGGGQKLVEELISQTKSLLENTPFSGSLEYPYAFNLFPHNSNLHNTGYLEEEEKIHQEINKVLNSNISISTTCIRVPVLRAHSISLNIEFTQKPFLNKAISLLEKTSGIQFLKDTHATPHDASGKNEVFVSKLRLDRSHPNSLELWVVGDQLLKGAALNALQIAELLTKISII